MDVRRVGVVKVLDSGLAKLADPGGAGADALTSNSPTLSLQATRAGVILGTAGEAERLLAAKGSRFYDAQLYGASGEIARAAVACNFCRCTFPKSALESAPCGRSAGISWR